LKTQAELADDIGITRQQMDNYSQLQKLSPDIQELVEASQASTVIASTHSTAIATQ